MLITKSAVRAVLVVKKDQKRVSAEFGLGDVISRAAICFPSHRSLFNNDVFYSSFEYHVAFPVETRSSTATGSGVLYSWAVVLSEVSGRSSL